MNKTDKSISPISTQQTEETDNFLDSIVTLGLVVRAPFRDVENIVDYISKWTDSRVVYRRTSVGRLRIVEEGGDAG